MLLALFVGQTDAKIDAKIANKIMLIIFRKLISIGIKSIKYISSGTLTNFRLFCNDAIDKAINDPIVPPNRPIKSPFNKKTLFN